MLKIVFSGKKGKSLKLLCLGAHSDDIEIGCGGTILRLLSEHNDVEIHWIVFGSSGQRVKEAKESANKFLMDAKIKNIVRIMTRNKSPGSKYGLKANLYG